MAFLKKLKHHGFTLRADKCKFFRTKVKLLGHMVTGQGVAPCPEITNKVEEFRNFTTVKQMQSFLGLVGYYRQYIPAFAQVTTPLRDAMEAGKATKGKTIIWSEECEAARLKLVNALQQGPPHGPLMHPDFNQPFRIAADGCVKPGGVGAILEQEAPAPAPPGTFRQVAYCSKALTALQRAWDVSRIEAYG